MLVKKVDGMNDNILDKALNFEFNKHNYSKEEREKIRTQLLEESYRILLESKAIFIDKMDDLNKLRDDTD